MSALSSVRRLLDSFFRRSRVEREMEEELRAHLQSRADDLERQGIPRTEAERQARIEFGGYQRYKEECREALGTRLLGELIADLRYGLRQLRRNPGFTAVAVITLALGIAASLSIFAFVDAALIKPLPYPNPTRLVEVTESIALFPRANLSYPDYLDWKRLNKVFSSLDVWAGTGFLLSTPAGTQPELGTRVSSGFFRTLGITPALGRDFDASEDLPGAPRTVILSYAAWQKWFGGRKNVIGQAVELSGVPFTEIGVLPQEFQFAPRGRDGFWTTLQPLTDCEKRRSCHDLDGVARLRDGVSVHAALAGMKSIAQQLEKRYPESNRGQGASVAPLAEVIVGTIRPILLVLLGGAGLLLLIACVNVTSLLLVRSESRKREIAVRGALGASPSRLTRQFVTEGFMLATAGCGLGLISAQWAMELLTRLIPAGMMAGMPYIEGLGLNFHVLAFAGVIWLAVVVWFSIAPGLRLSLAGMREGLTESGRGSGGILWRRFGPNLVVAELAIAVVMLAGAGLLGKSFYRLLHVNLGFQPDHLATLQVVVPEARYKNDQQIVTFGRQIVSRLSSLPGVESAGIASRLPLSGNGNTDWIRFVGRPYNGDHNEVNERDVSAGYFQTLHARLLRGRYFTDAEDESKPRAVIINQALAGKYFPGEDPIGKQIGDDALSAKSIRTIIGVVDNIREGSLDSEIMPAEYLPFNQSPDSYFGVVARTSQAPKSVLATLGAAIHEVDPGVGTAGEETISERIGGSYAAWLHRSAAWLVGGFAALALLLSVVGLYGVIAYSVSQRTREIGVRMALGAQRGSVYRLILGEAAWLAGIGIVLGLVCSVAAARLIRGLLFGTQAVDVPTLAAVALVLGICSLLASFVPARRATKVDPMVALRYE